MLLDLDSQPHNPTFGDASNGYLFPSRGHLSASRSPLDLSPPLSTPLATAQPPMPPLLAVAAVPRRLAVTFVPLATAFDAVSSPNLRCDRSTHQHLPDPALASIPSPGVSCLGKLAFFSFNCNSSAH
ncbi:hypothetical protein M407DRAFT_25537 [Tulasnella calospora MUT 4182]|uniref:Uncharacterized protein n=1 Tax=Tulasnella calospora MUT 4182 TaxID=1051891 RepID=A0A0C3QFW5_9AGAM|nr:hypothetical protein M407DRAFT_25537 [Tulasnella calospora MUT 4182]